MTCRKAVNWAAQERIPGTGVDAAAPGSAGEERREGAKQARSLIGRLVAQRVEHVLHLVRGEVAVLAVGAGALDERGNGQLRMELGGVLPGPDAGQLHTGGSAAG